MPLSARGWPRYLVVWQARRTRLNKYSSPIAGVHPNDVVLAMSDDEVTHPGSDGSANVTPQRLPSLSNLASPVPLPLSSEGAGPSAEGLADGPIAHRLRPCRKPAGYYKE